METFDLITLFKIPLLAVYFNKAFISIVCSGRSNTGHKYIFFVIILLVNLCGLSVIGWTSGTDLQIHAMIMFT